LLAIAQEVQHPNGHERIKILLETNSAVRAYTRMIADIARISDNNMRRDGSALEFSKRISTFRHDLAHLPKPITFLDTNGRFAQEVLYSCLLHVVDVYRNGDE
jgi:hypothetical protein